LDQRSERFILADINNDGQPDILLFGRSMVGVATVTVAARNVLRRGPLLFPELSVSDMAATDLNGDRITDVVIAHWLSNRLLVRFGIGRGVFSEQMVLDLPAEPDRLSLITVPRKHAVRVLVSLPEAHSVAHVIGNASGEFAVRELIPLPHKPLDVRFAFINNDNLPDMVCLTTGGTIVMLGSSSTSFAGPTTFGAGKGATCWTIADADGDGWADMILGQPPDRFVVLSNSRVIAPPDSVRSYATGTAPAGLLLGDFNGDGTTDIAVANSASADVSVFFSDGSGCLTGQCSYAVDERPESLFHVRTANPLQTTLLAVHTSRSCISVLRIPRSTEQPRFITIPTGAGPEVIAAVDSYQSDHLKVLMHYRGSGASQAPVALIEQIGGKQFVERSFHWPRPFSVAAMAAAGAGENSGPDLFMSLRDEQTRSSLFVFAPSGAGYDYKPISPLFQLPDSLGEPRCLIAGSANGDRQRDLLIFLGFPSFAVGVSRASSGGTLVPPERWVPGVAPSGSQSVALLDADGDGSTDLVYVDNADDCVKVLYGNARGEFAPPGIVMTVAPDTHIACGIIGRGGRVSLVTAERHAHTITIHPGVFLR
jgi:hypothetical protein